MIKIDSTFLRNVSAIANGKESGKVSISVNSFNYLASQTTDLFELPEDYKQILEEWINSGSEYAIFIENTQGPVLSIAGKTIPITTIQEKMFWDSFFEELQKLNIVQLSGFSGRKHSYPIYKLSDNLVYIKNQ